MNNVTLSEIQGKIFRLHTRSRPFMLGQDLAYLYKVETRQITQAVKRNPERFPDDFFFQLTDEETKMLKSQNVISISEQARRANPYGFYREGANMLSAVLSSTVAAERSVQIMRAFSNLEETSEILVYNNMLQSHKFPFAVDLKERLTLIESKRKLLLTLRTAPVETHTLLKKSVYEICVRLGEVVPNEFLSEPLSWRDILNLPDGSVPFGD